MHYDECDHETTHPDPDGDGLLCDECGWWMPALYEKPPTRQDALDQISLAKQIGMTCEEFCAWRIPPTDELRGRIPPGVDPDTVAASIRASIKADWDAG